MNLFKGGIMSINTFQWNKQTINQSLDSLNSLKDVSSLGVSSESEKMGP